MVDFSEKDEQILFNAVQSYKGHSHVLESALGFYMMGFMFGWRHPYLAHSQKTVTIYEAVLGVRLKDNFPVYSDISNKYSCHEELFQKSNDWKYDSKESLETDPRDIL